MQFDPLRLMALDIPEVVQRYGPRDCVLYALGVGAGMDPLDERQLAFVDERRLRVVPTMAAVLGYEGFWIEQLQTGINASRALHAEQRLRIETPLSAARVIRRKTEVTRIVDRGVGRGAFVCTADTIVDDASGKVLAVLDSTILCRDEGGLGGTHERIAPPQAIPDRAPDGCITVPASPQQALIYRLSGDANPLHSDPAFARAAGFSGPILHGLASYGSACLALLCAGGDRDPARVRAFDVRFSGAVTPGEVLKLDHWQLGTGEIAFRLKARDRGVVVVDNGRLEWAN